MGESDPSEPLTSGNLKKARRAKQIKNSGNWKHIRFMLKMNPGMLIGLRVFAKRNKLLFNIGQRGVITDVLGIALSKSKDVYFVVTWDTLPGDHEPPQKVIKIKAVRLWRYCTIAESQRQTELVSFA